MSVPYAMKALDAETIGGKPAFRVYAGSCRYSKRFG